MIRQLYLCMADQHDWWIVAVAACVCLLGSYATFAIGVHAVRERDAAVRRRWGIVSMSTTTCAIWATHFIAMLAFRLPFPSGFLVLPTVLSFVVALALVASGWSIALFGRNRAASTMAGVVVGIAISAMHYTGMSAFRTTGTISWDAATVGVSILIGAVFGALAGFTSWNDKVARVWGPALLLTIAVCGDHFFGMSAATIAYDPSVALPAGLLTGKDLAPVVAAIAGLILCGVLAGYRLHVRTRERLQAERQRFRDFAAFAVEGLVICDGDTIVWVNDAIVAIAGKTRRQCLGQPLEILFTHAAIAQFSGESEIDTVVTSGSSETPVRVITKSIVLEGRPHVVIAIRDQRDRLRAEAELRRLADSDALTGLANRTRYNDALARMLASQRADRRTFALLSLDLDRFKYVNDAHGHATGDALLVRVAGRLQAVVDDGALVARIGGDEFAILAQGGGGERIQALAEQLVDVLSRPFVIDGQVHEIGASIGVAIAPSDGDTASVLVRNADLALYRAKDEGRGTYRMFEPGMDARMQARRRLELALRRAVERQEFELHYQPQVEAATGIFTGAEALIRWMDPDRGRVPPLEFITVAEETNLIAPIGEWVLHTACVEAATWPAHLNIAVNLSPVQFRDPRLFSIVVSALEESGLPGHRLELEVTESVLIDDEAGVLALLQRLKTLGVKISLDDFGTGYSSLGHLRRFPFDKIKIDRSFVSHALEDRGSAAIVRAVVSLGNSLGITTTAEGVETAAQRDFVVTAGCDQIQGFFFSRPTPAAQLPQAFRHDTNRRGTTRPCPSSDSFTAATAS